MRFILFYICICVAILCNGASVRFGDVQLFSTGENSYTFWCDLNGFYGIQLDVQIQSVAGSSQQYVMTFDRIGSWLSPENWVAAKDGDLVDASTTRNLTDSEYLLHHLMDDGGYVGGGQMSVDARGYAVTSVYLAFACSDSSGHQSTLYPAYTYGWAELTIDSLTGELYTPRVYYDLEGGPMVVGGGAWTGGIPEPSGWMLMLLGVATLGLKRGHNNACMA